MGKKREIEGADVCICLHTALRKYCDSKITSAAYNLIHLIHIEPAEQNAWLILGDYIAIALNAGTHPLTAVKSAVERLNDSFFELVTRPLRREGKRPVENASTVLHALQCTLQCFNDSDWEGFIALLYDTD